MTREEAIELIDDRMCFGRGKWSKHHEPEIDEYWQAGQMAIEALRNKNDLPISPLLKELKQPENESEQFGNTEKLDDRTTDDCISRADVEQTVEDNILCYTHSDRPIDQDADTECHMAIRVALKMLRKDLRKLQSAQPERKTGRWIPCDERLPECEQEVLICTMKRVYVSTKTGMERCIEPIITSALYEDGSMLEVDSKWHWEDVDYAGWDEEEDCGIIPEGWWENRYFNPDGVYNNPVDQKVVAWMPLPEPYKEGAQE